MYEKLYKLGFLKKATQVGAFLAGRPLDSVPFDKPFLPLLQEGVEKGLIPGAVGGGLGLPILLKGLKASPRHIIRLGLPGVALGSILGTGAAIDRARYM